MYQYAKMKLIYNFFFFFFFFWLLWGGSKDELIPTKMPKFQILWVCYFSVQKTVCTCTWGYLAWDGEIILDCLCGSYLKADILKSRDISLIDFREERWTKRGERFEVWEKLDLVTRFAYRGTDPQAKGCRQLLEAENSPQFPDSEETGSTGTKNWFCQPQGSKGTNCFLKPPERNKALPASWFWSHETHVRLLSFKTVR